MPRLHLILVFLASFIFEAAKAKAEIPAAQISDSREALANARRCLETIKGDEERIADVRNWVAENLSYLGEVESAYSLLQATRPHYHVPFGCIDVSVSLLGQGQASAVPKFLNLALEKLIYAVGHGAELAQFQILRLATVIEQPALARRAREAEKFTRANPQRAFDSFLRDFKPNLWDKLLDRFFPARGWQVLSTKISREEEVAWKAERAVDYFSALVFLREAQARVRAGGTYPRSWIRFAEAGINVPAVNTRPVLLSLALAELALLENQPAQAFLLVENSWKLLSSWAPQMSGIYAAERNLALLLVALPAQEGQRQEAKDRLARRAEIAQKFLDPFEQMVQLPVLAEGMQALGQTEPAQRAWEVAAERCAENLNPESQSTGLTRIWMSFARAKTWPTPKTQALLEKIERQLPAAYAKVNF